MMAGSMGLMASFVLTIGWAATEARLVRDAAIEARTISQLLGARTKAWLTPATAALRQLVQGPLPRATEPDDRLAELDSIADELAAEPLLASVYVGWNNGDFLLVRPLRDAQRRRDFQAPDGTEFLVQLIDQPKPGQQRHRHLYFGSRREALGERTQAFTPFDPRKRPWFVAATDPAKTIQSAPYTFFTTGEMGISLSRRSTRGEAVVGIDVTLQALAETLVELRRLPAMRLALVDREGYVLASADAPMAPPLRASRQLQLSDLQAPALEHLWRLPENTEQAVSMELSNGTWVGGRTPSALGLDQGNVLLMATPFDELVAPARARVRTTTAMAAGLALLLLPLAWWGGGAVAHALDGLRGNVLRLLRFNFQQEPVASTRLLEVKELAGVLAQMRGTIEAFVQLSQCMATELDLGRMLNDVLSHLVKALHAHAGRVYLFDADSGSMNSAAEVGALRMAAPEQYVYDRERSSCLVTPYGDGQGQQLELELRSREGRLQGMLMLDFDMDEIRTDPAFVDFSKSLSGMLAVAIETRELIQAQRRLFDGVIQLMAGAIDSKSPYMAGHCNRVPQIALALMDRLCSETNGPYAGLQRSESERYAFYLGAWLHDCGKVTSPEHIVDKATKLELIYNRIHEIRTRFEVLWRDEDIAHFKRVASGHDAAASQSQRDGAQQQLREDFAFVAACNIGGEFMSPEDMERVKAIGSRTWERHFDRGLGLSREESQRWSQEPSSTDALPATEKLLDDRPEHVVPWDNARPAVERSDPKNVHGFDMVLPPHEQNQGEIYNLCIGRGTLTAEDRFRINDHIVQTYRMLKKLPWPAELRSVPEFAASHHEKLDGQGYPRRLSADQLQIEDRVMALADVFEALTASDRPYKPPKSLSESLRIMALMAKDRHLDADLFRYFLHSRLWETFAEQLLPPEQRDAVDITALEALMVKAH